MTRPAVEEILSVDIVKSGLIFDVRVLVRHCASCELLIFLQKVFSMITLRSSTDAVVS